METAARQSKEKTYSDESIPELGHLAVREKLRTNDSLAHVRRLIETKNPQLIERQIYAEFHADIGERTGHANQERHFYKAWDYRLEDNDFISDTGLSLREMMIDGLVAAANDVRADPRLQYHFDRARIQAGHPDMLVQWRKSGDARCVRLVSVCPESREVDEEIAKLGNFKPERMMASVWIFEPTSEGMRLHAFSQDNLTLEGLAYNDHQLGIQDSNYSSSLAKLAQLDVLNFTDGWQAVRAHKDIHDQRLESQSGLPHHFGIKNPLTHEEAIASVEAKPENWQLYWNSVQEVAASLQSGRVSSGLSKLVLELRTSFDPASVPDGLQIYWRRPLSEDQARGYMDYLRERAIPQYVFGRAETTSSIAEAGAYSVENGIVHSGDCPSSADSHQAAGSKGEMAAAMQVYGQKKEFESDKCRTCKGQKVRAWMKGEVVGCYNCGRQENICTGEVIEPGIRSEAAYLIDPFAIIAEDFRRIKREIEFKRRLKEQEQL